MKLKLGDTQKGPGYWKFNNKVLNDDYYKRQIKNIVGNIEKENVNFCDKWEMLKIKCREFTQRFCAQNKKCEDVLRRDLEKKLKMIQNEIDEVDVIDEQTKKEFIRVKYELEELYKKDCRGASIRARVKWIEEGEKNTKYFMGLEKINGEKKNIVRLRKDNSLITKQHEILNEVVSFYEQLYSIKKVDLNDVNEYLKDCKINKLSENDKNNCEGLITIEECHKVIVQMTKNKAPGGDGLTIEFYQEFWNEIKYIFVNALNANFDNNVMSETQKQGLITLIYKKGEPDNLNNWRPITLLNYDYKIMAAVLANRMQKVISSIIHENQVGYIKNRLSGFNIRLTQDVFQLLYEKRLEGAYMMVDFTKAFDTIEFQYIEECLKHFNFGVQFCKWVKIMYKDVKSSVLINGWKTKSFEINRGIRQGCPLSALLFLLAVEILAEKIRQNKQIKGVMYGGDKDDKVELKLLQYADDTSLFFREKSSLKYILEELELFEKVAGPVVNKEKTILKWLGPEQKRWDLSNYVIPWSEGCVKYLGIYIGNDQNMIVRMNWETKLQKIQRMVDNWKKSNLTLFGKVLIVKTLLISQVINLIMYCSVPQPIIKRLDKILYNFLWNSKIDKIKREIVI